MQNTPTADQAPVTIDVVSDAVCPWCYVGKRRFEKALAQGKIVMGHAAGLNEHELDGYAAFGITAIDK